MIICCLGDSLTEGDYGGKGPGIADVHEKNYPYFLQKITGAEVHNFGMCGFTASLYLNYYKSGAVKVDDADIIIVLLGTNGGHSIEEDTQCNKDYRELIKLLQKDSKAKIYLCTPPNASTNPEFCNCGYADKARSAAQFVRQLAKETGLPLIDLANSKRITPEHEKEYQANDGLHFVEKGYQVLAEEIHQGLSI